MSITLLIPLTLLCLIRDLAGEQININNDAPVLTQESGSIESLVEKPSSINLSAILDHQKALELECAKYHEDRIRQLEQLLRYQDDNYDLLQLPNPLPVKVPAVCLFLFSQFRQPEPMAPYHSRLDFVNWIYNEEEIRNLHPPITSNNNKTSQNSAKKKRETQATNTLLNDYIYDSAANYSAFNEIESNDVIRFHEEMDQMMSSKPYKEMIENNRNRLAKHLSPVILIPGLLGSRLQAKTDKKKRVNIFCSKQNDWQDMWLSLRQLLPVLVDCWLDNVRLEYDPSTGFTKSPPGVEARVPDFGSVESVRYLDLKSPKMSRYFAPIIEQYEKLGYVDGLNLHAAPYDFRLAPQEMSSYFEDLQRLQTPDWRQKQVRKVIALSSPWGGAVKAVKALVVGDQLDLPLVSEAKMRKLARTFPSISFLLPQPEIFSRPNKQRAEVGGPILVQTPERNYRAADIPQLLGDLQLDQQAKWFHETASLIKPLEPLPDVHVDCIHSVNIPTPETLLFRNQSNFPNGEYELITGEGDGTVNFESLMVCDDWNKQLPDKVKHKIILNTNHLGVLGHKTTLTHISDDVLVY